MTLRASPLSLLVLAACGGSTRDIPTPPSTSACGDSPGQVVTLATASGNVDALVSDGANLYWLDGTSGQLSVVPTAGGASRVLATLGTLWDGPCGGVAGTSALDCRTFSLAVDEANVYAAGPLGIVSVSKSGGAPRTLVTLDGKAEYVLGPLLTAGGALFWPQMDVGLEEGQPDLTAHIARLDPSSSTPQPFPDASTQAATASILAADANRLYWLGGEGVGGVLSSPLAGGATTTLLPSSSLAVVGMTVSGDRLTWVNQQQTGGCVCPGPEPAQLPEMVEAVPVSGGAPAPLITFPMDTDPSVSVLGDTDFTYVLEQNGPSSSIVAISPTGGTPTTLAQAPSIELLTLDSCSVYFAAGSALQKVAKPTL